MNWDNLIVKFNDQNRATVDHIKTFDKIPFKNKLCFVAPAVDGTDSTIQFTEFEHGDYVKNDITSYSRYLNIDKFLNEHTE